MLQAYLPALVMVLLGAGLGLLVVNFNRLLGPRRTPRQEARAEPHECGLPSRGMHGERFPISFYLFGMLALIFAVEAILLYPVAVQLRAFGLDALVAILVFLGALIVAFVYEWHVGALDWERQGAIDEPDTRPSRLEQAPTEADQPPAKPRVRRSPVADDGAPARETARAGA